MSDEPTESRPRATADIDAGWGALLDGIGHSGPLVVASEPAAAPTPTLRALPHLHDDDESLPPLPEPTPSPTTPVDDVDDAEPVVRALTVPTDDPEPPIVEPSAREESADARVLEVAAAVPRPIEAGDESWPRRPPVEIVARATDSHRVARAPSVAPPRRASTAVVEPPAARASWQWFAGAAVIVAAIGWVAMRPSGETPAAKNALASSSSTPRVDGKEKPDAPAKPAAAVVDPPRAAAKVPASPPVEAKAPVPVPLPAPVPVPVPAPTPTAPPTPTTSAIEGTPAELLAAANTALGESRFAEAHALADRSWDGERTNDAVRVMALAACEMPDGALARDAFRKLDGPTVRKEAYVSCKRQGIDVRAKIDGYTPKELLAMARREAARGDHEKAYEHARASNRLGKSAEALQLMAESACHKKDADNAAYLIAMLPRDRKSAALAVCTTAGTTLPDPD